jgi:hypothetical protein
MRGLNNPNTRIEALKERTPSNEWVVKPQDLAQDQKVKINKTVNPAVVAVTYMNVIVYHNAVTGDLGLN